MKNARPVHVSETWEQIVILGSLLLYDLKWSNNDKKCA
jgi:hypothetical protein